MKLIPRSMLMQLSIALILVQFVVTLLMGAYFVLRVHDVYSQQTIDTLTQVVPIVERTIEDLGVSHDADIAIKRQFGLTAFRVTVIDPSGIVQVDSTANPVEMENHLMRDEIQDAIGSRGEGWSNRQSKTLGIGMMYYAKRYPKEGPIQGVIRVSTPLSIIYSEVSAVIRLILLVGGLMLLLTMIAILLVSRSVSSNIKMLVNGAKEFSEGNLHYRIASSQTSELEELRRSLNSMAVQMSRSLAEIEWTKNQQTAILQSMPTGVIALDRSKTILSFNRAAVEILGVPSNHDPRGWQLEEYIRDVDLSTYLERVSLNDADDRFELVVLGTNGSGKEVIACVVPLGDAQGDLFGYLVLLEDVTTLRQLEGIRSDFSANVSHELRTPITTIKGYAEMLEMLCPKGNTEIQRCIGIISRNTERLEMIIEDLLSLATLESRDGGLPSGVAKVDLKEILSSVVSTCDEEATLSNVELAVEGIDELLVMGSRQLLVQAFTNLVQNAIRYGGDGGIVRIHIARDGDMAVVAVSDKGGGIPRDLQPRLFERFFRVDKGRSRSAGGTGLGLAIVKHVAIAHGGTITVDSELDQGATFEMRIKTWK